MDEKALYENRVQIELNNKKFKILNHSSVRRTWRTTEGGSCCADRIARTGNGNWKWVVTRCGQGLALVHFDC